MSALYRPRRWPPDPNDPEQQQDDPSLYGPNLGPAGGPAAPPPPTPTPTARPAAAEASMYQPNPTGQMPDLAGPSDPMQRATQTLYAPAQEQQAQAGPPGKDQYLGEDVLTKPEPPERIPYPAYNPFSLGHANAMGRAEIDAQNKHNEQMYEHRLRAWGQQQSLRTQAGYYSHVYGPQTAQAADIRGQYQVEAAKVKAQSGGTAARFLTGLIADPNTDEVTLAWAQDALNRMPQFGNFAPRQGAPKSLSFAPDGTPIVFDPTAGTGSVLPGYQTPQPQPTGPNFNNVAGGGSSTAPTVSQRSAPPQAPPAMAQPAPRPAGALPPGPYTKGGGAGAMRTSPEQLRELAHAIAPMDVHSLSKASDVASRYGSDRAMLFNLARQENPQFDWATVERRRKMLDDFQNGKSGVNLQSLDTFLGHAGDLAEVIRATPQSSVPLLNKSYNWWRTNMSGDPQFARLKAAIAPVGREFMNFILNNKALYEIDKEDAQTILNGEMPLNMMLATLEQMGQTVDVRYGSMDARFRSNMGAGFGEAFPDQFSKRGIEGAHKLGIDLKAPGGGSAGAAGHTGGGETKESILADYARDKDRARAKRRLEAIGIK